MNKKVITTILTALLATASYCEAMALTEKEKKPKRLSTKKQLVIERQRADSLAALVEEYRQRESDWQKAWHDAQQANERKPRNTQFAVDYTPAHADSLAEQLRLQHVDDALQNFFNNYVCEPVDMSTDTKLDSLYAARLKTLVSPIHLPYNQIVRTYIQRYTDGSGLMSRVLSLSQYYFPMIDEELLKAGLPVELHSMAIIESALSATAYSRAGAAGLWQFMPTTGKAYGLEINSMVDERYDPLKATRAACRYMKDLYDMYNDWSLAIAAYNCGPGNVNKAMARAGGNPQSFWDVYDYLPRETRGYVPAFIAASYAYAYHQAHNITYSEPPMPIAVDTIQVSRLLHLGQVSSTIDVSTEALKMLNPQYKLDIIPATTKSYALVLPANRVTEFISNQDSIFAKDSTYLKEYLDPAVVEKKKVEQTVIYYRVKSGDTLGAIARRHHVTTTQLMRWNGLKNANKLSIGQRLKIEKR
ncbi:MAG: transglycosylase SLT domain-containing protein [Alistipes sp.]|nr:transglycosylase SLT domain-containing protein [Alistipes sp.]